jgi:hypothetical protein
MEKKWFVNSEDVLDDIREVHPTDQVRTLALDLASCGQEVMELRAEVKHLALLLKERCERRAEERETVTQYCDNCGRQHPTDTGCGVVEEEG